MSVDELIMLRKLRKSKQGMDIDKLNRGEEKRRKHKEEGVQRYGLQKRDDDVDEYVLSWICQVDTSLTLPGSLKMRRSAPRG